VLRRDEYAHNEAMCTSCASNSGDEGCDFARDVFPGTGYRRRMRELGPILVVVGLVIAVVGVLAWSGALAWFGRLPGDVRIGGEHSRVYIPITSMLIVSIVLSVLLTLFRR
jgi:hypothetical protein